MCDDIEDLVDDSSASSRTVYRSPLIFPKKSGRKAGEKKTDWLPEEKSVFVRTFGCAHNQSDSEYMAGVLASEGYVVTANMNEADAWVVNSCTVKDPSQAAFLRVVGEGRKGGKAVVVAGCVPQAQRNLKELEDVSVIGVKQIGRVGEAVAAGLRGERFSALGTSGDLPELELPKIRRNELVEIVPLSTGCLGACTYCKTRHARGKLGSYRMENIVERVKGALEDGVSEVWLSSEDTGAYGIDLGYSLSDLLTKLVDAMIPYPFAMLRIGMSNPPYLLSQLDKLSEILESPNVFAFVHVPVQSGSNEILSKKRMNREYTVEDFAQVVERLSEKLGGRLTVSTDIICGFPGETEEDFQKTLDLVEKCRLSTVNISQFYARPGTPAASMRPRVPTDVVKARSRSLTKLVDSLDPYSPLVGNTLLCSARDELADGGSRLVAHTKTYVKVIVPFDIALIGAHFEVVVHKAHRWHVDATVSRIVVPAEPDRRPALASAIARLGLSPQTTKVSLRRKRRPTTILLAMIGALVACLLAMIARWPLRE